MRPVRVMTWGSSTRGQSGACGGCTLSGTSLALLKGLAAFPACFFPKGTTTMEKEEYGPGAFLGASGLPTAADSNAMHRSYIPPYTARFATRVGCAGHTQHIRPSPYNPISS